MTEDSYLTDEQLARALRSDPQVLGVLIERYEHKLTQYILRKSHATREDVKDILQNIFIKVYKNINEFDTALKFSSWVYRIAYNEMIDWYRKEKRTPRLSLEGTDYLVDTIKAEVDVAALASAAELQGALASAIATLPSTYQDIVELRFLEEKSYDEIADILRIPPGTVAVRLSRVKTKLRDALKHYGTTH